MKYLHHEHALYSFETFEHDNTNVVMKILAYQSSYIFFLKL